MQSEDTTPDPLHDHPRLRELLGNRSMHLHMQFACGCGDPRRSWFMELLVNDLDTLTRCIAVLLGHWETPWPEGESAPALAHDTLDTWELVLSGEPPLSWWTVGDVPGLDQYTTQEQALDAARCIVRHLLEQP